MRWSRPTSPNGPAPVLVEVAGDLEIAVHVEQDGHLPEVCFADSGGGGFPVRVDLDEPEIVEANSIEGFVLGSWGAVGFSP
jgi:hypothetical protein